MKARLVLLAAVAPAAAQTEPGSIVRRTGKPTHTSKF